MKCVIMSGIPGSGKSTFIKRNYPAGVRICSADDYWTDTVPFNVDMLTAAHNWCYKRFIEAITSNEPLIIVDNTNIKVFEIAPYYRLAEALDYEVLIIRLICDPMTASTRQIHSVPLEKLMAFQNGFEPLPSWWKISYRSTE